MRGHRADLHLTATPRAFLEALLQALPRTQTDAWRARVGESARARERALSERLNALSAAARIDPSWVAACLAEALGPDDVVVNELSLPAAPLAMQPGSYFRSGPASCLGWGLNAALGIRLASPQKTVVAVLGDGAYLFANPAAAHQTAAAHGIATLTIVLNNEEMGSIREQVSRYHPGGWADRAADYPLTQLPGLSHVERIVEAFGGHGESVQAPGALPDALRRCLRLVREGRQVVLNVRI
ncbi:MAG: hypothetical protein FJX76_23265 [Armatimonadetes bacterium]|nr:hypothetical protein [Armatimonadota bacterium]